MEQSQLKEADVLKATLNLPSAIIKCNINSRDYLKKYLLMQLKIGWVIQQWFYKHT